MVDVADAVIAAEQGFQYSLCRVVLMVSQVSPTVFSYPESFSTRSVESF